MRDGDASLRALKARAKEVSSKAVADEVANMLRLVSTTPHEPPTKESATLLEVVAHRTQVLEPLLASAVALLTVHKAMGRHGVRRIRTPPPIHNLERAIKALVTRAAVIEVSQMVERIDAVINVDDESMASFSERVKFMAQTVEPLIAEATTCIRNRSRIALVAANDKVSKRTQRLVLVTSEVSSSAAHDPLGPQQPIAPPESAFSEAAKAIMDDAWKEASQVSVYRQISGNSEKDERQEAGLIKSAPGRVTTRGDASSSVERESSGDWRVESVRSEDKWASDTSREGQDEEISSDPRSGPVIDVYRNLRRKHSDDDDDQEENGDAFFDALEEDVSLEEVVLPLGRNVSAVDAGNALNSLCKRADDVAARAVLFAKDQLTRASKLAEDPQSSFLPLEQLRQALVDDLPELHKEITSALRSACTVQHVPKGDGIQWKPVKAVLSRMPSRHVADVQQQLAALNKAIESRKRTLQLREEIRATTDAEVGGGGQLDHMALTDGLVVACRGIRDLKNELIKLVGKTRLNDVPEYAALQPRLVALQSLVKAKAATADVLLAARVSKAHGVEFLVRWQNSLRVDDSWEDAKLPFDASLVEALARRCQLTRLVRMRLRHATKSAFAPVKPGASAVKNTKHSTALLENGKLEPQFNKPAQLPWAAPLEMDSDDELGDELAQFMASTEKKAKVWAPPMQQLGGFHLEPVLPGVPGTNIIFSHGSIISFKGAAIVNAANTGCIGGAGVDGAINEAGGKALRRARRALPIVKAPLVRCETGDAKMTTSGDLQCTFVIHAVGPNYHSASQADEGKFDELLYSAYLAALREARAKDLPDLAFSLISSGIYCAQKPLRDVLAIGLLALIGGAYANLREVHLAAFTAQETEVLRGVMEEYQERGEAGLLDGLAQEVHDIHTSTVREATRTGRWPSLVSRPSSLGATKA